MKSVYGAMSVAACQSGFVRIVDTAAARVWYFYRVRISSTPIDERHGQPLGKHGMGLTYFRRYRMEFKLSGGVPELPPLPYGYELVPFEDSLIRQHATAKYQSFRRELDADVFPCLARQDGCLQLMREIARRDGFVPEATWLLRFRDTATGQKTAVGTVQGLSVDDWGAIQNLGVIDSHRGRGLGSLLLLKAADGFKRVGLGRMHLEVTTENSAAVRMYERIGFKKTKVVYKAADVAGA